MFVGVKPAWFPIRQVLGELCSSSSEELQNKTSVCTCCKSCCHFRVFAKSVPEAKLYSCSNTPTNPTVWVPYFTSTRLERFSSSSLELQVSDNCSSTFFSGLPIAFERLVVLREENGSGGILSSSGEEFHSVTPSLSFTFRPVRHERRERGFVRHFASKMVTMENKFEGCDHGTIWKKTSLIKKHQVCFFSFLDYLIFETPSIHRGVYKIK